MDYKIALSALLIAHFLGDFYLCKSGPAAKAKSKKCPSPLWREVIYALCVLAVPFPLLGFPSLRYQAVLPVLHTVTSIVMWRLDKRKSAEKHAAGLFFAAQAAHIAVIAVIAWFCVNAQGAGYFPLSLKAREIYFGLRIYLPPRQVIHFACLFLFAWEPASAITDSVLEMFKGNREGGAAAPEAGQKLKSETVTGHIAGKEVDLRLEDAAGGSRDAAGLAERKARRKRAGKYIGVLERYIIVILFLLDQYIAIALMSTKTVVRSRELQDADFAEEYLIGTLTSQLLAMAAAAILRSF